MTDTYYESSRRINAVDLLHEAERDEAYERWLESQRCDDDSNLNDEFEAWFDAQEKERRERDTPLADQQNTQKTQRDPRHDDDDDFHDDQTEPENCGCSQCQEQIQLNWTWKKGFTDDDFDY